MAETIVAVCFIGAYLILVAMAVVGIVQCLRDRYWDLAAGCAAMLLVLMSIPAFILASSH
jgi:heme/copper-type cytochrome/quinol oxidase subunit 1